MDFALKTFLGGISHVRRHHLNEAEATGLPSVRVAHDIALLDVAILLEQTSDLVLSKARMDSGDEEVRAGVARVVVLTLLARLRRWSATVHTVAIVRRGTAGPASIIVATVSARGAASVAVVAARLVVVAGLGFILHGRHGRGDGYSEVVSTSNAECGRQGRGRQREVRSL